MSPDLARFGFVFLDRSRHPREWQRLCALFERCLVLLLQSDASAVVKNRVSEGAVCEVVTNNYLEFWLRYARALKAMEAAEPAEPGASLPREAFWRGASLQARGCLHAFARPVCPHCKN